MPKANLYSDKGPKKGYVRKRRLVIVDSGRGQNRNKRRKQEAK